MISSSVDMIHDPEKFVIPTVTGGKLEVLVNWNQTSSGCGFVKLRTADGKEFVIPRIAFIRVAMFLGKEAEQEALIPTKSVSIRHLSKDVTIRLRKDMLAGETLTIPVSFDVPLNADTLPALALTDNYS